MVTTIPNVLLSSTDLGEFKLFALLRIPVYIWMRNILRFNYVNSHILMIIFVFDQANIQMHLPNKSNLSTYPHGLYTKILFSIFIKILL